MHFFVLNVKLWLLDQFWLYGPQVMRACIWAYSYGRTTRWGTEPVLPDKFLPHAYRFFYARIFSNICLKLVFWLPAERRWGEGGYHINPPPLR